MIIIIIMRIMMMVIMIIDTDDDENNHEDNNEKYNKNEGKMKRRRSGRHSTLRGSVYAVMNQTLHWYCFESKLGDNARTGLSKSYDTTSNRG